MTVSAPVPDPIPAAIPAVRERKMWDVILTIVLLVLYLAVVVILSSLGLFFVAFAGDSCGASATCNYDTIANGALVVVAGPWIPVLPVLVVSIILLVKKRIAFWISIVGGVLSIVALVIGFMIASAGVVPN